MGCAAAGYFLTPEDILSKSGRSRGNVVVATSAPTQYENPQQQEPVVEPAVVEPETTPNQPVVDESDVVPSGPATIEPVSTSSIAVNPGTLLSVSMYFAFGGKFTIVAV